MSQDKVNELYKFIKKDGIINAEEREKMQKLIDEIFNDETIEDETKNKIANDVKVAGVMKSDVFDKMKKMIKEIPARQSKKEKEKEKEKKGDVDDFEKYEQKSENKVLIEGGDDNDEKKSIISTSDGQIDNIEQYFGKTKQELAKIAKELFPFGEDMEKSEKTKISQKRLRFKKKVIALEEQAKKGIDMEPKKEKKKKAKSEPEPEPEQIAESSQEEATIQAILKVQEGTLATKYTRQELGKMTLPMLAKTLETVSLCVEKGKKITVKTSMQGIFLVTKGLEGLTSFDAIKEKVDLQGLTQEIKQDSQTLEEILTDLFNQYPELAKYFSPLSRLGLFIGGHAVNRAAENKCGKYIEPEVPIIKKKDQPMNTGTITGTGQ